MTHNTYLFHLKQQTNMTNKQVFIGTTAHSVEQKQITMIEKGIIVVTNGIITAVETITDERSALRKLNIDGTAVITRLEEGQFLIPGFIDAHIHAPQFPNAGIGYDSPLLDWLKKYTFPLEMKYKDTDFARKVYTAVVDRTLSNGTTTAAYFATIHLESCVVLAEVVAAAGQRGLIGKVNMNMNCPPLYQESTEQSLKDTEIFVSTIHNMQNSLIKPILTPRFAISCNHELLKKLSDMAKNKDLHIQTHVSENKEEVEGVKKMFPHHNSYCSVYDDAQLLTPKTLLAHGVYLTDAEIKLLAERGSTIVHCPNSNISLQSGLCNVRKLMDAKVNVALGTDVSGGYSPSILDAIRSTIITSKALLFASQQKRYEPLSYHEAFYLATMGGAIALKMEDEIGNFIVGKKFDALLVDVKCKDSPMDVLHHLNTEDLLQKFLYTGDDRNICRVYINGHLVHSKA